MSASLASLTASTLSSSAMMLRKMWMLLRAVAALVMLSACSNTLAWQEEVQLLDGRVIVVVQKRRYEGAYNGQNFGQVPRESWVTFNLPDVSDNKIVWHENIDPQILNIYEGKIYIVGMPHTEREFHQYGSPRPSYVG